MEAQPEPANSGQTERPKVRVIVVNFNGGDWLGRCLESLKAQTMKAFEAVIVDNNSSDDSFPDTVDDPRFTLVRHDENLGFAVANNLAAEGTIAPWIALLNPDAIAEPDWLENLLEEAQDHPQYEIFGSTQIRADQPDIFDGTGDNLSGWGISWRSGFGDPVTADRIFSGEVMSACGAAMMIATHVFKRLKGFEPRFFCYVEDVDFCLRARLQGVRVLQSGRAKVQHACGASGGGGTFSAYIGHRNLYWMHMRCMPWSILVCALTGLTVLTSLRAILLMRWNRPHGWALIRAMRDGLLGAGPSLRERRKIQASRVTSTRAVASWLSWVPNHYRTRPRSEIRPREP